MQNPKIIILGGGSSIKEGLSKDLWNKIKDHFVLGINYSYKYYTPTAQVFVDRDFYEKELPKGLDKIPLIIGKYCKVAQKLVRPNTILLKACSEYNRNLSKGVYKSALSGIFTLSIAIYLLDKMEGNEKEVYLLGYDFSGQGEIIKNGKKIPLTHFYQNELTHRGTGKTNYYMQKNRPDRDFAPFKGIEGIKIYNVSPNSRIPDSIFTKIDYDQFFSMLATTTSNQDQLRSWIQEQLKHLKENK